MGYVPYGTIESLPYTLDFLDLWVLWLEGK